MNTMKAWNCRRWKWTVEMLAEHRWTVMREDAQISLKWHANMAKRIGIPKISLKCHDKIPKRSEQFWLYFCPLNFCKVLFKSSFEVLVKMNVKNVYYSFRSILFGYCSISPGQQSVLLGILSQFGMQPIKNNSFYTYIEKVKICWLV